MSLYDDVNVYRGPTEPERTITEGPAPTEPGQLERALNDVRDFDREHGTHPSKLERQYGRLF